MQAVCADGVPVHPALHTLSGRKGRAQRDVSFTALGWTVFFRARDDCGLQPALPGKYKPAYARVVVKSDLAAQLFREPH